MSRLIDADALLERMKRTNRYFNVKFDIDEAPTVDAVPVVRCGECVSCSVRRLEYNGEIISCFCNRASRVVKENDYCSYGERREVDGNEP